MASRHGGPVSLVGPDGELTKIGVQLSNYDNAGFARGRSPLIEALWILVAALFVSSPLPGSVHRRLILRLFGARVGKRVVIKPRVRVKFPWRLVIGEDAWIGESVWIDNLAHVRIGANVCISQGAYLCGGSHNWASPRFDLMTAPIKIEPGAWIAARAIIGPGVTVHAGAVLTLGSVATADLAAWTIHSGGPAQAVKAREFAPSSGSHPRTAPLPQCARHGSPPTAP